MPLGDYLLPGLPRSPSLTASPADARLRELGLDGRGNAPAPIRLVRRSREQLVRERAANIEAEEYEKRDKRLREPQEGEEPLDEPRPAAPAPRTFDDARESLAKSRAEQEDLQAALDAADKRLGDMEALTRVEFEAGSITSIDLAARQLYYEQNRRRTAEQRGMLTKNFAELDKASADVEVALSEAVAEERYRRGTAEAAAVRKAKEDQPWYMDVLGWFDPEEGAPVLSEIGTAVGALTIPAAGIIRGAQEAEAGLASLGLGDPEKVAMNDPRFQKLARRKHNPRVSWLTNYIVDNMAYTSASFRYSGELAAEAADDLTGGTTTHAGQIALQSLRIAGNLVTLISDPKQDSEDVVDAFQRIMGNANLIQGDAEEAYEWASETQAFRAAVKNKEYGDYASAYHYFETRSGIENAGILADVVGNMVLDPTTGIGGGPVKMLRLPQFMRGAARAGAKATGIAIDIGDTAFVPTRLLANGRRVESWALTSYGFAREQAAVANAGREILARTVALQTVRKSISSLAEDGVGYLPDTPGTGAVRKSGAITGLDQAKAEKVVDELLASGGADDATGKTLSRALAEAGVNKKLSARLVASYTDRIRQAHRIVTARAVENAADYHRLLRQALGNVADRRRASQIIEATEAVFDVAHREGYATPFIERLMAHRLAAGQHRLPVQVWQKWILPAFNKTAAWTPILDIKGVTRWMRKAFVSDWAHDADVLRWHAAMTFSKQVDNVELDALKNHALHQLSLKMAGAQITRLKGSEKVELTLPGKERRTYRSYQAAMNKVKSLGIHNKQTAEAMARTIRRFAERSDDAPMFGVRQGLSVEQVELAKAAHAELAGTWEFLLDWTRAKGLDIADFSDDVLDGYFAKRWSRKMKGRILRNEHLQTMIRDAHEFNRSYLMHEVAGATEKKTRVPGVPTSNQFASRTSREIDAEELEGLIRARFPIASDVPVYELDLTELVNQDFRLAARASDQNRRIWDYGSTFGRHLDPAERARLLRLLDDAVKVHDEEALERIAEIEQHPSITGKTLDRMAELSEAIRAGRREVKETTQQGIDELLREWGVKKENLRRTAEDAEAKLDEAADAASDGGYDIEKHRRNFDVQADKAEFGDTRQAEEAVAARKALDDYRRARATSNALGGLSRTTQGVVPKIEAVEALIKQAEDARAETGKAALSPGARAWQAALYKRRLFAGAAPEAAGSHRLAPIREALAEWASNPKGSKAQALREALFEGDNPVIPHLLLDEQDAAALAHYADTFEMPLRPEGMSAEVYEALVERTLADELEWLTGDVEELHVARALLARGKEAEARAYLKAVATKDFYAARVIERKALRYSRVLHVPDDAVSVAGAGSALGKSPLSLWYAQVAMVDTTGVLPTTIRYMEKLASGIVGEHTFPEKSLRPGTAFYDQAVQVASERALRQFLDETGEAGVKVSSEADALAAHAREAQARAAAFARRAAHLKASVDSREAAQAVFSMERGAARLRAFADALRNLEDVASDPARYAEAVRYVQAAPERLATAASGAADEARLLVERIDALAVEVEATRGEARKAVDAAEARLKELGEERARVGVLPPTSEYVTRYAEARRAASVARKALLDAEAAQRSAVKSRRVVEARVAALRRAEAKAKAVVAKLNDSPVFASAPDSPEAAAMVKTVADAMAEFEDALVDLYEAKASGYREALNHTTKSVFSKRLDEIADTVYSGDLQKNMRSTRRALLNERRAVRQRLWANKKPAERLALVRKALAEAGFGAGKSDEKFVSLIDFAAQNGAPFPLDAGAILDAVTTMVPREHSNVFLKISKREAAAQTGTWATVRDLYREFQAVYQKSVIGTFGSLLRDVSTNIMHSIMVGVDPKNIGKAFATLAAHDSDEVAQGATLGVLQGRGIEEAGSSKMFKPSETMPSRIGLVGDILRDEGVASALWRGATAPIGFIVDKLRSRPLPDGPPAPGIISNTADKVHSVREAIARGIGKATDLPIELREKQDAIFRLAHYYTKLDEGMSPAEAALCVKRDFGDFQEFTQLEKDVLSGIFFFYSWRARSVGVTANQFFLRPFQQRMMMALSAGDRGQEEDAGGIPMLMQTGSFVLGKDANNIVKSMQVTGASYSSTTVGALNSDFMRSLFGRDTLDGVGTADALWRSAVSNTPPFVRGGVEWLSGVDMFSGRSIRFDPRNPRQRLADSVPQGLEDIMPGALRAALGIDPVTDPDTMEEVGYRMDPEMRLIMTAVFPGVLSVARDVSPYLREDSDFGTAVANTLGFIRLRDVRDTAFGATRRKVNGALQAAYRDVNDFPGDPLVFVRGAEGVDGVEFNPRSKLGSQLLKIEKDAKDSAPKNDPAEGGRRAAEALRDFAPELTALMATVARLKTAIEVVSRIETGRWHPPTLTSAPARAAEVAAIDPPKAGESLTQRQADRRRASSEESLARREGEVSEREAALRGADPLE